jgi:DNA (cytosine-5)-methyltransferase 1
VKTRRVPQSRDRLLVMFWQKGMRRPDLDKWMMRPRAWCTGCDEQVAAMQVFKKADQDMGRYGRHGQYYYRCPHRKCGGQVVEPEVLGAIEAIDWTIPAVRIGDRVTSKGRPDPLEPATIARIEAGIAKHWGPLHVPSGGTWRTDAVPASVPMPSRTTRESDGLAVPPPFVTVLRNNAASHAITDPLTTISAGGGHHGIVASGGFMMRNNGSRGDGGEHCTPFTEPIRTLTTRGHQSLVTWDLLVPYYSNGNAQLLTDPMGALSTRDRYALACGDRPPIDVNDAFYRMLAVPEIGRGMGYADDYIVLGNVKQRVRQYGQSCTPVLGELAYSAIIEAITGETIGDDPWAGYQAQRLTPPAELDPADLGDALFSAADFGFLRRC